MEYDQGRLNHSTIHGDSARDHGNQQRCEREREGGSEREVSEEHNQQQQQQEKGAKGGD
jgi:hypothetical protein